MERPLGSREALRATMETASIEQCTERAFQAYLTSPGRGWRYLRLLISWRHGLSGVERSLLSRL